MDIAQIISDFEFLEEWEDRYRYVIELGQNLEPFPEKNKVDMNKVQGCVSQVWLTSELKCDEQQPRLHFNGDSDAHIVRGLIAIAFAIFSNQSPQKIIEIDHTKIFDQLQLKDHISPQRSNGLTSMVARIKNDAAQCIAHQELS